MRNLFKQQSNVITVTASLKRSCFVILLLLFFSASTFAQTFVTTGTASQGYALNSSAIAVDPTITVTSSASINGFRITISNGFKSNDVLSYTGSLPSGVSATAYNASTGILSFSGSTSAANWQTFLRTITYANSNSAEYGDRIITFSAGISSAFSNGHFYELINASSMSWTSAKADAAARSYLGYGGYLATITSAGENAFIKQVLGADAWIGASDDFSQINAATGTTTYANQTAAEGKWTWVTGPEKGTLFSIGNNSPVTQSGQFAFWNTGEPNNWGSGENFGEIYSSGTGQWNDLGTGNSIGYVVEYGGLSTDPVQSISSNATISTLISSNTVSTSQTFCNGGGTAATFIGSTPTGGNGTYTYSWLSSTTSASTGFAVASGTTTSKNYSPGVVNANTWYKRVVTSGSLKDTTAALSITVDAVISATTSQTNVNCNGALSGATSVVVSGGTSTYSYNWTPGNPTGDGTASITGLSAGTWTCTTTDALGCTLATVITLTQPSILTATKSQTNVTCNGSSTGTATVVASGGTASYTYAWFPSGGSNATATGLLAGSYTCAISDANSCPVTTKTFTITQPTALSATTSQTNVSCNGLTDGVAGVYNVSGGLGSYNYLWDFGGTNDVESSLSANNYTCTITDANNCTLEKNFTITEPLVLSASLSTTDVLCNGGSTGTATTIPNGGTSPYTYDWSDGSTSNTALGLNANNYSVTITDNNGCQFNDSISVAEPTALSLSISKTNSTCSSLATGSATASTTGGSSPYTYAWSTGETTATALSLAAGTYTVTVTDNHSCTSSQSITITNQVIISSVVTTDSTSCNGGSDGGALVVASGGVSPYTYLWTSGATTSSIIGLSASNYSVTVTDDNGCTYSNSFTVPQPNSISTTTSAIYASCNGSSDGSVLVSNTNGGAAPYSFLWTTGNTSVTVNGLTAGNYSVTVTDAKGCTLVAGTTIAEPAAISGNVSVTDVTCFGLTNGGAIASPTGGTSPYTFDWSDGQTTDTEVGLSAQTLLLTITDSHGCMQNETVTISQPNSISSTYISNDVKCYGESNADATITASGGTAPYTYQWASGNLTNIETGLSAGIYSVTVTDFGGCTSIENVTIHEPLALSSTFTNVNVTCNGAANGTATIIVTGGTSPFIYDWSTGDTSSTINGLIPQFYSVSVTDANGCSLIDSLEITEPSAMQIYTTGINPLCNAANSGSATAVVNGGTSPYNYQWSSGGISDTENNLIAGTYAVTVFDINSCMVIDSITLSDPTAIAIISSSTQANCGQSNGSASASVSGGTGAYTYLWSSGGTNDIENNLSVGDYTITVTDANGCSKTQIIQVTNYGAPTVVVSQTNITCHGDNNGTINLAVSGGTGSYTYSWNTSDTLANLSALVANTYSYVVTDSANCQSTGMVTIVEPDAIAITATTVNETVSNDGSINLTVTGGTSPYTYLWNDGSITEDISNLASGIYTVTITDDNGCTHTESISVGSSVGINQHEFNSSFAVYPNPNQGIFNIVSNHVLTVALKNNLGQLIKNITLNAENNFSVSIDNLSAGFYFIQNEKDNSRTMKKIVVIK